MMDNSLGARHRRKQVAVSSHLIHFRLLPVYQILRRERQATVVKNLSQLALTNVRVDDAHRRSAGTKAVASWLAFSVID